MEILEYQPQYKRAVIDLILQIQVKEFGIDITEEQQPDLNTIPAFYQHGKGNFWVSIIDDTIVGTVSLLDIGNDEVALRKMFVHPKYRGKKYGVSSSLLKNALNFANSHEVRRVYLGTTSKYLAAHRFYEKNGFIEVSKDILPKTFPVMAVDTKFYMYAF